MSWNHDATRVAAVVGWIVAVCMSTLFWLTYAKLQAKNEEAWSMLNRATVAEIACEKMENYVMRLENRALRGHWKRKSARQKHQ